MATQFFPKASINSDGGDLSTDVFDRAAELTRTDPSSSSSVSTANGPVTIQFAGSGLERSFWTPRLSAATITGTVTFNIWANESSMSANAGLRVQVDAYSGDGVTLRGTVVASSHGTELGTSAAAMNWTATPTSTAIQNGDRLRIRLYITDAGGTMGYGFSVPILMNGATGAGVSGDTYVQFNETLTTYTPPTPSDVPPTFRQRRPWGATTTR